MIGKSRNRPVQVTTAATSEVIGNSVEDWGSRAEPQKLLADDTGSVEEVAEPFPEATAKLTATALTAALILLYDNHIIRDFKLYSVEHQRLEEVRHLLGAAILRCRANAKRYARRHRR
jgi:hypothetical protein